MSILATVRRWFRVGGEHVEEDATIYAAQVDAMTDLIRQQTEQMRRQAELSKAENKILAGLLERLR